MCGIAGIICLDGKKARLGRAVHKMAAQMKNRGPEDEGYLMVDLDTREIFPYIGDDTPLGESVLEQTRYTHIKSGYFLPSHLAFAHRRLKIVDLSFNGHQPMRAGNGRYWIIFNGEIYNYKEIRADLEQEGHTFSSQTDTEVVLHAYMQWGPLCLQAFNGMFAFAIYDHGKREVFLARDRIGIKPLYYTFLHHRFIFASDIKTIIASGLYQPSVNWEGLWHNYSFSVAPRPMTVFNDVHSLPQAHFMRIDLNDTAGGSIHLQRYWRIPVGSCETNMKEREAVVQVEDELTRSIRYRLIADVQVGVFMSGGIDSTTISALSARLHPGISAFTLAFDSSVPEYNEVSEAIETARMHPMRHILERVNPDEILPHIDDMVGGYEEPICTLAPNYLLSKSIAKHGIVVVLNGLGGDELFGGYSHYISLNNWKWKKRIASISPLSLLLPPSAKRYKYLKTIGNYYVDQYSNFTENEKRSLFLKPNHFNSLDIIEKLYAPGNGIEFSNEIEALNYYDIMAYIGNHHVYRIDQFTMRFSLEGRFPFLDHHLVESAFRIPKEHKIKRASPMFQKYVLRKIAEKYIAPSCLKMPKHGFGLPVGRWMQNQLKELTRNSLEDLKKRDIFNNHEIDRLYHTFKEGSPHLYKKVWHLVMTELWFKHFIDNAHVSGEHIGSPLRNGDRAC